MRECATCYFRGEKWEFSSAQWRKGAGQSRCPDCVDARRQESEATKCHECGRVFSHGNRRANENSLQQHRASRAQPFQARKTAPKNELSHAMPSFAVRTHAEKVVECPLCNTRKRFGSMADAAAHIESGYCSGCRGSREQVRSQVYRYVKSNSLLLGDRGPIIQLDRDGNEVVPDRPYVCSCGRNFKDYSSLLQHRDATGHCQ